MNDKNTIYMLSEEDERSNNKTNKKRQQYNASIFVWCEQKVVYFVMML